MKCPGDQPWAFHIGVSDGTRTRDIRDHNAALYQLSYTHHGRLAAALAESTCEPEGNPYRACVNSACSDCW